MKNLFFASKHRLHPPIQRLDRVFCIFLIIFFLYLVFISRDFFYVPLPDFFKYLGTGAAFMQNPLSENVMSPPIYPLIVYFFETVLPFQYPGVLGGTVFNIICFITSLFLLWRIASSIFGTMGLLLPILIATHYYSYIIHLQPNNIALFTTITIACFYFYTINKIRLTYILAVLSILIRHEGIAILFALLLYDFFRGRKKTAMIFPVVAGSIAALYYVMLSLLNNNIYLAEWLSHYNELPNREFLYRSFLFLPFHLSPESASWAFAALVVLGIGAVYLLKQYERIMLPMYCFVLFYTNIHVFIPYTESRYAYPLLWIIYFVLLWPLHYFFSNLVFSLKHFAVFVMSIVIATAIQFSYFDRIQPSLSNLSEKRLAGEWLTNNVHKETFVFTLEPWITRYYTHNQNITFIDQLASPYAMKNYISESSRQNKDLIIVLDFHSANGSGYHFDLFGGTYYKNFLSDPVSASFSQVASASKYDHWASIYKLNKFEARN